jgi:hypothetical protein
MAKTTVKKSVQKNHPNGVQINMLLTADEAEELEKEVRRRQEENPGVRMSRAVLARDLVLRALRGERGESRESGTRKRAAA